jgi:multiple sugar transport system permease protein
MRRKENSKMAAEMIRQNRSPEKAAQARKAFARRAYWQRSRRTGLTYVVLLGLTIIFLAPFVWLVDISLKNLGDLAMFPIQWLPSQLQWDNFWHAVNDVNFWQYAQNSLTLALLNATLTTVSSALVGFGFARLRGPGKKYLFLVMLSTLMLPQIITLIPTYIEFSHFGLVDTYWPWVLWGLSGTAFLSFLFRQAFSSIPLELEEAALLDGCRYFQIFWRIFLPLSLPVIATAFLIQFTYVWGDYIAPSLLLTGDTTTLSVAITLGYRDAHHNLLPNVQAAASLLYVLPMILLFFGAQRFFVRGITSTGLKG